MQRLEVLLSELNKLQNLNDLAAFKGCLSNFHQWLTPAFNQKLVDELVKARAQFTDALLTKAWALADLPENSEDIALCAVGGYGRGQMQPYSDIDILIVSPEPLADSEQQQISRFITFLWDLKLDIGHSVRTIEQTIEAANDDVATATNLVEARLLVGSEALFAKLKDKFHSKSIWSSKAFFAAKLEEQNNRHHKFNDTSYNLEPNIKESPGCLRDIQTVGWVAKKHFREFDGFTLIGHGYFTQLEHAELIECRSKLWQIRFALHLCAKRNENRLLFDYQLDIANMLGFGNDKAGVEKFMRYFFRITRRVSELNSMLMLRFKQDTLAFKTTDTTVINDDFCIKDNLLSPFHGKVFSSPISILKCFSLITEHTEINGLNADCIRQLRNARRQFQAQYLHNDSLCRKEFVDLLSNPAFFDLAWDLMHQHGILQAYLPQWDHIAGMMQFDLFHAYTVDEHTHRLVKIVRSYYTNQEDFPICNQIVQKLKHPQVLFTAAIFHDIAKGRGGDHSLLGEQEVYAFCEKHEYEEKHTQTIAWLVKHHLLMSTVAQKRDTTDPEVVHEFASTVKTKQRLKLLYALTIADIRATNDNLWNSWKSSLLNDLYTKTKLLLKQGLEDAPEEDKSAENKQSARTLLEKSSLTDKQIDNFWETLSPDYFARFSPKQIAWHTTCVAKNFPNANQGVLVGVSNHTAQGGTEILIYCKDRPAIFAQIASVLDSKNCTIHNASITITNDGYVFDSLIVLGNNSAPLPERQLPILIDAIHTQLVSPSRAHVNKRRMSRRMRHLNVPTKVRFFEKQSATIIDLEALDSPGLLAKIGYLFVDNNITLKAARIATVGERAEDQFVVCNEHGQALTQAQQLNIKQQLLDKLSNLDKTK